MCVVYMEKLSEYVHLYGILNDWKRFTHMQTHINWIADLLTDDPCTLRLKQIYLHIASIVHRQMDCNLMWTVTAFEHLYGSSSPFSKHISVCFSYSSVEIEGRNGKKRKKNKPVNNKINSFFCVAHTYSLFFAWILNNSIHSFMLRIIQVGKSIRLQNYIRNSVDHILLYDSSACSLLTHNNGISLENDDILSIRCFSSICMKCIHNGKITVQCPIILIGIMIK